MNLETPECIICGNSQFSHYLDVKCKESNDFFTLAECSCCLILTSPRPTESKIEEYYNSEYFPHSSANYRNSFFNKIFRKLSYFWKNRIIKKYSSNDQIKLIDIGGGDGSLALYLRRTIPEIHVYEKDCECVDFINGKNIFSTNDLRILDDNHYNILTLFHSLEHVHDIEELFFNINRISAKNATMIIAVPNSNASEIRFLSSSWAAWDVPRHLYHFNQDTLSLLLDKYGWKIIESKNMFQDTLFNIYMSLKGGSSARLLLFLPLVVYAIISQAFFSNKRSTNLVVCRRK